MTDTIDLARAIAERIDQIGPEDAGPSAAQVLVDLAGEWSFLRATARMPIAGLPYMAGVQQAMDAALAAAFPPPRSSPFPPEAIVGELQNAAFGTGLIIALDRFAQLNWHDRRTVLEALAKSSPTLGGMHYLSILQPQINALPNVAVDVRAAWMAASLHWNVHEVSTEDLSNWTALITEVLTLRYQDVAEVFLTLGFPANAIEGVIAEVVAELDSQNFSWSGLAGLPVLADVVTPPGWFNRLMTTVRSIDITRDTYLEYINPKKIPYPAFMGTAVHTAIAAWYRANHQAHVMSPDTAIWTNTTAVEKIFNFFRSQYAMGGRISALARSAALTRPDIFEFVFMHGQPPGWVYEIKHAGALGEGLIQAEREALMYAAVLSVFGVPAVLGPAGAVGTTGVVPVPGGWAAFTSPVPGAIVYKIVKVPNEQYRLRFPASSRSRADAQKTARDALTAAAAAGAIVASVEAIYAFAIIIGELVVEYGWLMAL
jgi:hypothetical protein